MKLIIVNRAKLETYARLKKTFEDDLNVAVVLERRTKDRRRDAEQGFPERRSKDRRKWAKPWNGRDYIVIHIANQKP